MKITLQRLKDEFLPERHPFDIATGADTSGTRSLRRLHIASENKQDGFHYRAVEPVLFNRAMSYVPRGRTFIDIGCGKGRALILAADAGFKALVGVEFAPSLARIAKLNLASLGITAQIAEQDVLDFQFPSEPCVIFMYNPFGPRMLKAVIPRLRGHVIYVNPRFPEEFSDFAVLYRDHEVMVMESPNSI